MVSKILIADDNRDIREFLEQAVLTPAGYRVRSVGDGLSALTLARELFLFVRSNENGDRVGEFGVGTNPWVDFISGQHTLDENVPGVHLALGDPFGGETGATWSSKTRVSVIGTGMSLQADERPVIDGGTYAPEFVEGLGAPEPDTR